MEKAGSQATSIRSASGCCCAMHSTNWARRWWEGAATTSTSPRNVPESGWAPAKTVSCGTTPCAATAPYATQSCTAWQKANGPRLRDTWNTCCEPIMLIDFFYHLRARKLPVSVQEYLTLLQALKNGLKIGRAPVCTTATNEQLVCRTT